MYGKIRSAWRLQGDKLLYKASVPPNTTARLYLPAGSPDQVTEGGKPIQSSKGIQYLATEKERLILELISGNYDFEISIK